MGRNFERRGDEVVRATFARVEVELLRGLREELEAALRGEQTDDPVLQRLFPTAVLGDHEADRELRGAVRDELLHVRLEGLADFVDVLERARPHRGGLRVDLVDDEPLLVLGVLNDLRLAIGARIDIESLERDGPVGDDVAYLLEVMDHFAWLQEQLLAVVDPASVSHTIDRVLGEVEPDPDDDLE